ncbi:3-ketoacyl-ACP reductase FabG2 [Azospirillum sp.]|uniref:3-ketoacyl-ACP reductase FabG2 n=1 Tax=Azospirillum sp. TaxID=34012 RepID=UPI003D76178A
MKRTILVTGASKGIGRAVAERLAADGFAVAVHYGRDAAGGEATLAGIRAAGGEGRLLSFDIADRDAARTALEADMEAFGPYWGAVLNAGIARDAAFPAMADDEWDSVLHTNLDGFYNVLKPLVMPMVSARKGGRIVTLSSVSGLIGNRGQVNYSAAKAGIIGATKALAIELAKRNITVNCVAPGIIETQMTDGLPMEEALKLVPMRRVGKPEEVAAVVSFLCSDGAAYVTRQVIAVNGGMV